MKETSLPKGRCGAGQTTRECPLPSYLMACLSVLGSQTIGPQAQRVIRCGLAANNTLLVCHSRKQRTSLCYLKESAALPRKISPFSKAPPIPETRVQIIRPRIIMVFRYHIHPAAGKFYFGLFHTLPLSSGRPSVMSEDESRRASCHWANLPQLC